MNRNFLVTGGAQGIGLAISRRILTGGGRVFFTDINEKQGEETKESLVKEFGQSKVGFHKQDVTDPETWPLVWDEADKFFSPSKVEALCNNAGIFSTTEWKRMLDINLSGLVVGTMLAVERLGASRGGSGGLIVQTASMASFLAGFDTIEESVYTCSKQGVLGLVRSCVGRAYLKEKVRIVGLCPLFVNTELVRSQIAAGNDSVSKRELGKIRLIEPEEVGEAFHHVVVGGESGQMLVVMPGFSFYWPDWNRTLLKMFSVACMIYIKVLGHPHMEPVSTKKLLNAFIFVILLFGLLFHFFLNFLGF